MPSFERAHVAEWWLAAKPSPPPYAARAGAVRFRRFSIAAALAQERGALPPVLRSDSSSTDAGAEATGAAPLDDAAILGDPAKLRAAEKLLEGRPVKLLPDEECAAAAARCSA